MTLTKPLAQRNWRVMPAAKRDFITFGEHVGVNILSSQMSSTRLIFPYSKNYIYNSKAGKIIKHAHVQKTDFILKICTIPKFSIIFIGLVIFVKIKSAMISILAPMPLPARRLISSALILVSSLRRGIFKN